MLQKNRRHIKSQTVDRVFNAPYVKQMEPHMGHTNRE